MLLGPWVSALHPRLACNPSCACFLQVSFTFDASEVKVKLAEDQEISFPNRLGLETVEYLSVRGGVKTKVLKFP